MKYCPHCLCSYADIFKICPACGESNQSFSVKAWMHKPGELLHCRYVIGKCIGVGGSGCVYHAFDKLKNIHVAVKEMFNRKLFDRNSDGFVELKDECTADEYEYRKYCFLKEAKIEAKAGISGYCPHIYDCFEENGTVYIISEFIEGITLEIFIGQNDYSKRKALFPYIASELLNAVNELHKLSIIHRDISPDNIILYLDTEKKATDGGIRLKIIDFGSSEIEGTRLSAACISKKKGYSIPEEYFKADGSVKKKEDIYSVSAVLFSLITGKIIEENSNVSYYVSEYDNIADRLKKNILDCKEFSVSDITELAGLLNIHLKNSFNKNIHSKAKQSVMGGCNRQIRYCGALPQGSCLENRYIISNEYKRIFDCYVYKAYDMLLGINAEISEFCPGEYSYRDESGVKIRNQSGKEELFRDMADNFAVKAAAFASSKECHGMLEIDKILRENNTVYLVSKDFREFSAYADKNTKFINFVQKSVLDTAHVIFQNGKNHMNISPDNILLKNNGEVLIRFPKSIYSYSNTTDINQMSKECQDGIDDVYMIAEIVYYLNCGKYPPKLKERIAHVRCGRRDPLVMPRIIRNRFGKYSDILVEAMAINQDERCSFAKLMKIKEVFT